jgi:TfoX/Sxy family transcriptional regulator of competence genes
VAFDAKLTERVRLEIGKRSGLTERRMFGSLGFFIHGNLGCCVRGAELLVRVNPSSAAVKEAGARPFKSAGRTMKGWVLVDPSEIGGDKAFSTWVARGIEYASSLPKK